MVPLIPGPVFSLQSTVPVFMDGDFSG